MTTTSAPPSFPPRQVPPGHTPPDGRRPRAGAARPLRVLLVLLVVAAVALAAGVAVRALRGGDLGRDGTAGATSAGTAAPPATSLDPELERRFAEARAAADADGVELTLTSGWRSAAEQQELVDAAVERYGSPEEAHRWVLPPETSEHVAGLAIDVGPTDGALWLEQHGAEFGLCRTYANELWHFEASVEPGGTCPPMHDDASHGWR